MSTTPPTPPPAATLLDLANVERTLRDDVSALARTTAAVMADPRTLEASQRPVAMGRRMGTVVAVNEGPPLTADVEVNEVVIPGASPQSTYRPQYGDIVWLEVMGNDPHISPPITSEANRRWNAVSLNAGWSVYATWGRPVEWWLDPVGFVHLRGAVSGGAHATTIVTLPIPAPHDYAGFSVTAWATGTTREAATVAIGISGGALYLGPTTPYLVALDGISYRVD